MTKKMLIDGTHDEETRVAIVDDGRLDEFDYESAFRKPLRGNIYLAKVTRVEPSLQAAFVNYGGNRHGFLPFSEIHPDYFRIPIADREALMAEQEEALREHDEAEEEEDEILGVDSLAEDEGSADGIEEIEDEDEVEEIGGEVPGDDADEVEDEDEVNGNVRDDSEDDADEDFAEGNSGDDQAEGDEDEGNSRGGRGRGGRGRYQRGRGNGRGGRGGRGNAAHGAKRVESIGGDDEGGDKRFRFNLRRKYKIQEVVKRGQIMLIQVSKEERGNKGAAVTSYLSLPGRYCVLMPNSPRAGGVSRKISNYKDRAKMRDMMKDLEVPKGMSVILRTAGVERTKTEVKRDLDYLMRLWNNIRELTLESTAPALVYEEADLIKRAVRDLYTREIDQIHVAGEKAYKTAKEFMKMMIPSHVKRIEEYKDVSIPLFNAHKVEGQIAEIGETTVTLKSGGYLIINPTEALVSVDVNSGRATKERHIEETALKTNLEAAAEVARQLRLRDLGGLIVIDFIDMEDRRNNGKVERRMREALSSDKARIQMGRISSFGLMEMSRQRLSASLGETQYETCGSCHGSGRVRTADAASILVLRDIEAEGIKGRAAEVMVHLPSHIALYILNYKRSNISSLEARYGFAIVMRVDDTLGASDCRVEVSKPLRKDGEDDEAGESDEPEVRESRSPREAREPREPRDEDSEDKGEGRPRGRRRGRRGGRRNNRDEYRGEGEQTEHSENASSGEESSAAAPDDQPKTDEAKKPSRRKPAAKKSDDEALEDKPKRAPRKAAAKKADADVVKEEVKDDKPSIAKASEAKPKKAAAKGRGAKASNDDAEKGEPAKAKESTPKEYEVVNEPPKAKKKGWWSK